MQDFRVFLNCGINTLTCTKTTGNSSGCVLDEQP